MTYFRSAAIILSAGIVALATGCLRGPTEDAESQDNAVTALPSSLKIATFNAGLVRGGVALAEERLPLIAPALKATGADVLCLQEVWTDQDYESVRASLASDFPHVFRKRTEETGTRVNSCEAPTLIGLKMCVDSACVPNGVSAEECVENACKTQYVALSDPCKICLASNTGSPVSCLSTASEFQESGRNGLVLFSKTPIQEARFEDYGSALVHRGFIRATINGHAIACTHLTANLTTVPYPPGQPWSSWEEEQASQVDKVAASLPSKGCRIVLGDLNTSPAAGAIKPEIPETLTAFAGKGLRGWASPSCTWCPPPQNPLASGREEKTYDHILVNGCGTAKYSRIMDAPVDVQYEGRTLTTRLSDHFGVMAEIE